MGFNWGKMQSTPEGALARTEAKLSVRELVAKFEKQTSRDLEVGDIWNELVREITGNLSEITRDDEGAESAAEKIVERYERFLRYEKSLEDRKEQIAYIISVGNSIEKKRKSGN